MRRPWSQILVLALALQAAPAFGQTSLVYKGAWGTAGTGPGQFTNPWAVGVDAAGRVYVGDNHRIQVFTPEGAFISQFSVALFPRAVTVDATGLIHVLGTMDFGNRTEVAAYSAAGALTQSASFGGQGCECSLQYGGLAASASGDAFITDWGILFPFTCNPPCLDTLARVERYGPSGTSWWGTPGSGPGQLTNPNGVTMDASNVLYVTDAATNRVQTYTLDGTFLGQWGSRGSSNGSFLNLAAISASANGHIYTLDNGSRIQEFTSAGVFVGRSTPVSNFGAFTIAADGDGNVYAADFGNSRVVKFGPGSTPAPHVTWGRLKTHYR